MCVCQSFGPYVFVCVLSNQSTIKHHVICVKPSVNLMQGVAVTKVLRLHSFRSIISLSKITHQMQRDHTFSQRNKATKRGWPAELAKSLKKRGSKHLGRVFIKYKIGVRSPPPAMYVTLSRYASIIVSVMYTANNLFLSS